MGARNCSAAGDDNQRGAAAVEFALVVPFLLLIIIGIIQFGFAFTAQISLTQAAREAARTLVVQNDNGKAVAAAKANFNRAGTDYSGIPASCPAGAAVTVTIKWTMPALGKLVQIPLAGKAAMQCGG